MKKFIITINAYDHYAKFEVSSNDDPISLEQAIVDKLGVNDIKWEYVGEKVFASDKYRITYEEVIYDTRPIQTKKVLGAEVGTGASI
jgi:Zn-dependent membrane protease YugP